MKSRNFLTQNYSVMHKEGFISCQKGWLEMFLTSVKIHCCWGATSVPFPFSWHSSILTCSGWSKAWRQSCFPMLWRSSLWDEYSKYCNKRFSSHNSELQLTFFISQTLVYCTWLPPMLWHMYIITGLPPWLFSPTSKQVSDPKFLIWWKQRPGKTVNKLPFLCTTNRLIGAQTWLTAPNFSGVKSGTKISG